VDAGIDRHYYEFCTLSELHNTLRAGDVWVSGSRQFKDFEDYLIPAVPANYESFWNERCERASIENSSMWRILLSVRSCPMQKFVKKR
jgi:hypothetical protein